MIKKSLIVLAIAAVAGLAAACQQSGESNANVNAGDTVAKTTAGPDNSEITTTTDASGTRTETRVFRDNSRVSKVVVTTTRDGKRSVKVYSKSGEERELKSEPERALEATGDAIADSAGWVADKTETAADKTKEGAQTVAEKTSDTAKTVADKTASGAKKVGQETKEGAKKTGRKIKKIVTP